MIRTHRQFLLPAVGLLAVATMFGGCAGTGAGAGAGVVAYQERGIEVAADDLKLEMKIIELWLNHDNSLPIKVSTELYEGRALLTGIVDKPEMRADAVRLAWKVHGVKDVINEIQVKDDNTFMDMARDSWITTKLKSKLTVDKYVMAVNYAIETVGGVVYMIGIAQNKEELDRVISHARNIEYVRKVVSHVRLKDKA